MSMIDRHFPNSKRLYNKAEQYRRADIIIDTVCEVAGLNWLQLIDPKAKNLTRNIAIGIIALLCWDYGVHPLRIGNLINRSRSNMANQRRNYRDYVRMADNSKSSKLTMRIYNESKQRLNAIFANTLPL